MKLRKSAVNKLQVEASLRKNLGSQRDSVTSRGYSAGGRPAWIPGGGVTRVCRPSGKGRFGKRVTSSCVEYERHLNDNSNDSGFECDWNSQSESQFGWNINNNSNSAHCLESTDDFSQQSQISTDISIPKFAVSSYREVDGKGGLNKSTTESDLMKNVGVYLPMKELNEDIGTANGIPLPLLGNNMSPDSTMPSPTMPARGSNNTISPNSQSSSDGGSSSIPSPVPIKRPRFCFSPPTPSKATGLKLRNQNGVQMRNNVGKRLPPGTIPTLTSSLQPSTRDGNTFLQILAQPEEQHRARYQTEGSRGAIKDRKCNGFPTIKLEGYDKPATLQIFIGSDQGKVSPHMFYQACKVTGKSSTPCIEKKVEGTVLIEIEFEPSKDMIISCDCVGILKERNVDVEQRFPFHHASATQSRKKSTKCRMIFRTTIINSMGQEEALQVASLPILCTQPPGQPEICKQSLSECPASGGREIFIIGKNFLKDTKIVFQEENNQGEDIWESKVVPLKDYLQQTHLICVVPSYREEHISAPVDCKISVWSGGKLSEPHRFTYVPNISTAPMGLVNSPALSDSPPQSMMQNSINHSLTLSPVNVGECQQVVPVEMRVASQAPVLSPDPIVGSSIVSPTPEYIGSVGMNPVCHLSPTATCGSPVLPTQNGMCTSPVEQTLGEHLSPHNSNMGQMSAISFESNIMTTSQPQFTAVDELKSLLEQSAEQDQQCQVVAATIADVKPDGLLSNGNLMDIKPSSTFSNLSPNMSSAVVSPMELQFPSGENSMSTITTTGNFSNINNPFHVDSSLMSASVQMPSLMTTSNVNVSPINTMVESNQHQILPLMASTTVVAPGSSAIQNLVGNQSGPININLNCLEPIMKHEGAPAIPRSAEGQPQTGNNNGVVFINGELQGPIANALTQMSDNELINYINPSCFDQGSF